MSAKDVAAYTPPVGMKSLEQKLMHNGMPGEALLEPEWAEVRIVMRERTWLLETLRSIDTHEKRLRIDQGRGLQAHIEEALHDVE